MAKEESSSSKSEVGEEGIELNGYALVAGSAGVKAHKKVVLVNQKWGQR